MNRNRVEDGPTPIGAVMRKAICRLAERQVRPLVTICDGFLVLRTGNGTDPYDIRVEHVQTEAKLLGLMVSLCEKSWFTTEHCEALIVLAHEYWGREVVRRA